LSCNDSATLRPVSSSISINRAPFSNASFRDYPLPNDLCNKGNGPILAKAISGVALLMMSAMLSQFSKSG
jgi:hypothetical protein